MAEISVVDVQTASARCTAGAVLLDVREPQEWEAGHAVDATWIPMSEISERHTELPADRDIYVICRSGGRSLRVAEALQAWGYTAHNVDGGSLAWSEAGLPFVDTVGNPGVVH
ncbi:MAG: rhodanese-like domain-containing protein [Acidimicrobiia bacterium]